jgi:hypothetical protein
MNKQIQEEFDAKFEEIGEDVWHDIGNDRIFYYGWKACEAALSAVPANHIPDAGKMVQPTDISKQLREYAADSGYSHNDYADTMLAAALEIERCAARLEASQAQQSAKEPVKQESWLTRDEIFKIYCEDKNAGDWHRPQENYEAGYRKGFKDAKSVGSNELRSNLVANMVHYLGATKTQAKALVDGVFDGEHTINQADLEPVSIKTAQERLREKYPTNTDSDDLLIDYVEWVEFQRAESAELRAALEALYAENAKLKDRTNQMREIGMKIMESETAKNRIILQMREEAAAQAKRIEDLEKHLFEVVNDCIMLDSECSKFESVTKANEYLSAQKGTE